MATYGSATAGRITTLSASARLQSGKIYRFEYAITGFKTIIPYPGWQNDAVNDVISSVGTQVPGAQILYVNVDDPNKKVIVEFKAPSVATAFIDPITAVVIISVAIAIVAAVALISMTVTKIAEVAPEALPDLFKIPANIAEIVKWGVIGGIALGGVYLALKLIPWSKKKPRMVMMPIAPPASQAPQH